MGLQFRPLCIRRPPRLPRAAPQSLIPRRIVTTSTTNTAPIDIPKLIVSPGSIHHNSLPTFLEYASRKNLSPSRTVYVGTHYEYIVALALLRLGFSLLRTGRKSDAGIDLIGHWCLPPLREPLPVIVQCKARKITCNPSHIRELEGSFQGIPADWRRKDVLGLLVTTHGASKGTLEALGGSRWPLGFLKVDRDGTVKQFVWNSVAAQKGLEGVGVTIRYTPRTLLSESGEQGMNQDEPRKKATDKFENTGTRKDIQLTWMGSPIFPNREGLDQETMKLKDALTSSNEESHSRSTTRESTAKAERVVVAKATKKRAATTVKGSATSGKKRIGRPPGSKNKKTLFPMQGEAPQKKRGRPKGTKNTDKVAIEPNG